MPTIKIVPFPGVPGPQGPRGLQGLQGERGLTGPIGPAADPVVYTPTVYVNLVENNQFSATGRYIKNGKLVFVFVDVDMHNVTNFGEGQIAVSLPFAPAYHSDAHAGSLHKMIDGSPQYWTIKGHLFPNMQRVFLWTIGGSPDEPFTTSHPVTLTSQDKFHISFVYEAV